MPPLRTVGNKPQNHDMGLLCSPFARRCRREERLEVIVVHAADAHAVTVCLAVTLLFAVAWGVYG